jgi:cobalt-zinc-cadmium efflux system outer membrane protein
VAAWEPAGTLVSDFAPPSLVQAKQDAMGHPELQLLAREREAARAALAGTRTERYPETAVSGGYLRNNEEGEGGVLLGLSLSIPLFDRKQGAIAQGTSGIEALEQETAAERLSRLGRIERVHAAMVLLEEKMGRYRETILPKAARILASLTGYYERGMVDILDVLEARAVAIEKEVESIELREQWAALAAELLELAGTEVKVVE